MLSNESEDEFKELYFNEISNIVCSNLTYHEKHIQELYIAQISPLQELCKLETKQMDQNEELDLNLDMFAKENPFKHINDILEEFKSYPDVLSKKLNERIQKYMKLCVNINPISSTELEESAFCEQTMTVSSDESQADNINQTVFHKPYKLNQYDQSHMSVTSKSKEHDDGDGTIITTHDKRVIYQITLVSPKVFIERASQYLEMVLNGTKLINASNASPVTINSNCTTSKLGAEISTKYKAFSDVYQKYQRFKANYQLIKKEKSQIDHLKASYYSKFNYIKSFARELGELLPKMSKRQPAFNLEETIALTNLLRDMDTMIYMMDTHEMLFKEPLLKQSDQISQTLELIDYIMPLVIRNNK